MNSGFQDPYLIPGTNVLINKLNLTDNYELSIQEERLSKRRANELAAQGITGEFDLDHFKMCMTGPAKPAWSTFLRVELFLRAPPELAAATYGIHRVLEQENFLVDLERVGGALLLPAAVFFASDQQGGVECNGWSYKNAYAEFLNP